MKAKQLCVAVTAAALSLLCIGSISASAYTADDVAAKARAAGWPESLIQVGYNQWATGNYTQAKLDAAYDSVEAFDEDSYEMICNLFGLDPDDYRPEASTEPESSTDPNAEETPLMLTKKDGTVEERIAPKAFIKLSYDEKQAYIDSLTEESKKAFMASLTGDERRSMLKELPAEDKASLVQKYIDTASDMGLSVTVDSIEGNNLSMTIRNEEGVIVDKAATSTVVDETGLPRTAPLAAAAGGVVLAAAGFAGLYYYIRKTEQ